MAEIDPNKPQATDPVTVADLARVLSIRGSLGVLDVLDVIIPTISVGSLAPISVTVLEPAFRSSDVFSAGVQTNAAANTVHADTTGLPTGTYDVRFTISPTTGLVGPVEFDIEHRNAANAANLAVLGRVLMGTAVDFARTFQMSIGYELVQGERLRILNLTGMGAGNLSYADIYARIRQV